MQISKQDLRLLTWSEHALRNIVRTGTSDRSSTYELPDADAGKEPPGEHGLPVLTHCLEDAAQKEYRPCHRD